MRNNKKREKKHEKVLFFFAFTSERLFKQMADLVVSDGYHDVGYTYINVDDCWLAHDRDQYGRLQPDADRFPSGMKALADYVS